MCVRFVGVGAAVGKCACLQMAFWLAQCIAPHLGDLSQQLCTRRSLDIQETFLQSFVPGAFSTALCQALALGIHFAGHDMLAVFASQQCMFAD